MKEAVIMVDTLAGFITTKHTGTFTTDAKQQVGPNGHNLSKEEEFLKFEQCNQNKHNVPIGYITLPTTMW